MRAPLRLLTSAAAAAALLSTTAALDPGAAGATARPTVGGARLATHGVVVDAHAPRLPAGIDARGWVVADAGSGQVLAARDPHGRYLPASTLKTLTALTLLPQLTDRRQVITADTVATNVDGTRVGLVPGGHYSVQLLFQCMLMMSGNDCATALAETAGHGSVRATLARMNATARAVGAADTRAGTPSGLDAAGQASSAYDLALILRRDIAIPDFRAYNSQLTGFVPAQGHRYPRFAFANDDRLRAANYPGIIAAKNGYTDAARHEFVCAVKRGSRTLIVTLMHAERSPVDTQEQAIRLLDWGFAADGRVAPVGSLVTAQPARATPSPTASGGPERSASPGPSTPAGSAPAGTAAAAGGHGGSGWRLPLLVAVAAVVVGGGAWGAVRLRAQRR